MLDLGWWELSWRVQCLLTASVAGLSGDDGIDLLLAL